MINYNTSVRLLLPSPCQACGSRALAAPAPCRADREIRIAHPPGWTADAAPAAVIHLLSNEGRLFKTIINNSVEKHSGILSSQG